jgi:raffinose/stachyose/melibiose transport system permease protein
VSSVVKFLFLDISIRRLVINRVLSDKKAIALFISPALLFFIGIVLAPILISFHYSTLHWNGVSPGTWIGFDNYKTMFFGANSVFPGAAKNSFLFAGVSLFIQLPISLFLALVLANGVRGEGFYRSVFFIPVIISTVVIGQLWMKVYHPEYGLLNTLLRAVNMDSWTRIWLGSKSTALGATFVPLLWQYIGYHMLLMYGAIKSIPPDIFEAARIDGASSVRTSLFITIPLIRPMLRVSATFALIGSLKIFDLVYVLTNGGPGNASEVPTTLLVKSIFMRFQYGYGSAMAIFVVAECLLFTVLIQWLFRDRDVNNKEPTV